MTSLDPIATEIFQVLRSYDYTVEMWDEDGTRVYEPEKARRLWANPKNIMVSLVENGENTYIRLSLGKLTEIGSVMGLDQTLRTAATKFNLLYQVRRNSKTDIKPAHFATKASVTEHKKENNMNIVEGMHGTSKSSYWKLEEARMIVRHSTKVNENERSRNIRAIYVENAKGERFLFPSLFLSPARAMTQHVNHGGKMSDPIGEQIIIMAEHYANLVKASGYITKHASKLSESAIDIQKTCRTKISEMKKIFEQLSLSDRYITESKSLSNKTSNLSEHLDSNIEKLNAIFGEGLDYHVIISISEAMKDSNLNLTAEQKEKYDKLSHDKKIDFLRRVVNLDHETAKNAVDKMRNAIGENSNLEEDGRTSAVSDEKCPKCRGKGEDEGGTCSYCQGSGVDSIMVCGRPVSRAAWEDFKINKLPISGRVSLDREPSFSTKDAELSFKLGAVVSKVKNDSMVNFLSYVSEELSNTRNNPSRLKSLRHVAIHAIKLAGLNIDEGFISKNKVIKEFSNWLSDFSVEKIFEYEDGDEQEWRPRRNEETINNAIEGVTEEFNVEDFFEQCGKDFGWDDETLFGSDLEYEKSYITGILAHYLSQQIERTYGFEDVDMEYAADNLWNTVKSYLDNRGYSITESAFGREDVMIPTNQGEDLKREVEPSTITDIDSGDEVEVDQSAVNRIRSKVRPSSWTR